MHVYFSFRFRARELGMWRRTFDLKSFSARVSVLLSNYARS